MPASLLLAASAACLLAACKTQAPDGPAADSTATGGRATEAEPADFEGEIEMRVQTPDAKAPDTMLLELKRGTTRFSGSHAIAGGGYGIYDRAKGKVFLVLDSKQNYTTTKGASDAPKDSPWVANRTGKHETVLGYDCEDWELVNGRERATACVTSKLAPFDLATNPVTGAAFGIRWGALLGGGFPLRAASMDAKGELGFKVDVVRITRKAIDDARVTVPPAYREVDARTFVGQISGTTPP